MLLAEVNAGRVADAPHRRRGQPHPRREVRARAVRAARSPRTTTSTRSAARAPGAGPRGGRGVAGAAQERRRRARRSSPRATSTSPAATPTTSATRPAAGPPSGRASPATTSPAPPSSRASARWRRDATITYSADASAPIRRCRRRHRGGRRDAVLRGLRRHRRPAVGLRPGRDGVLRPVKDMPLSADRPGGGRQGLRGRRTCIVRGRLRPPTGDHRPARRDGRAGGVLAAGQRGRGRGRRAVRPTRVHRQAVGDVAPDAGQVPINVGDANYDPLYPYGYGLRTTH